MADNVQVYTEGGMPSNRQVCGVRNTRLYAVAEQPIVAADLYKLFDLNADEVILGMGIDVLTASAAGSATVSLLWDNAGTPATAALVTDHPLTAVGKTAIVLTGLPKDGVGDTGVVQVVVTNGELDADFNVYAIVANVASPESFTPVDTPAP